MYYLYKKRSSDGTNKETNFKVCRFKPTFFKLGISQEKKDIKLILGRMYFWFITGGRYEIFYLLDDVNVAHTSYVVPKCAKFSFLNRGDYEIGPCVTSNMYRRNGCYSYILEYITTLRDYADCDFYMIVNATNEASIKGIEKARFTKVGMVTKTKLLKYYKLNKEGR